VIIPGWDGERYGDAMGTIRKARIEEYGQDLPAARKVNSPSVFEMENTHKLR